MRKRLRGYVVLGASLAFVALSPAVAAESADATSRVCAAARALTDDRRPQDAETLINAQRRAREATDSNAATPQVPPACPEELIAAQAAIDTAAALARDASDLRPPDGDPGDGVVESWAAALERAEEALAVDERNVVALGVVEDAHANMPAHRAARSWNAFVEAVRPLGPPLLAVAVVIAGLGLLARTLTPIQLNWPILRRWERGVVSWAGLVSLLAGGLLLVWGPIAMTDPRGLSDGWFGTTTLDICRWVIVAMALLTLGTALTLLRGPEQSRRGYDRRSLRPVWFWTTCVLSVAALLAVWASQWLLIVGSTVLPGAAGAALGVYGVATWLATRLRLSVEVKGAAEEDSELQDAAHGSAHLIAMLGELGAKRPRGLEVPTGSDVQALRGEALGDVPQQALAQVAVRLLQGLLGTRPWRVVVEDNGDDRLAVVITRNGRSAGSSLVERRRLLRGVTTDRPVDLYRAAAATIMTTLASHHQGFEGLCGATDPGALACYYVATADLLPGSSDRLALLRESVEEDPGNWLAQLALAHARWRRKDDTKSLRDYLEWLDDFVDKPSKDIAGFFPLRVRGLHTRATVAVNLSFKTDAESERPRGSTHNQGHAMSNSSLSPTQDAACAAIIDLWEGLAQLAGDRQNIALVNGLVDESIGQYLRAQDWLAEGNANDERREALRDCWHRATSDRAFTSEPPSDSTIPRTPYGEYNLACYLATRLDEDAVRASRTRVNDLAPDGDIEQAVTRTKQERIVQLLRRGVGDDPYMREAMYKDPTLTTIVNTDLFRSEFARPPLVDLSAMKDIAPHRERLVAAGLNQPERVATRQIDFLAAELCLDITEATRVQRVACTVASVPASVARFDIAQVLLDHGVEELSAVLFDEVKEDIARCFGHLRLTEGERKAARDSLKPFAVWPPATVARRPARPGLRWVPARLWASWSS